VDLPKRKNIRLQGYDYSQNGAYFVTICTNNRVNMLCVGAGFHARPLNVSTNDMLNVTPNNMLNSTPIMDLSSIGVEAKNSLHFINNNYDNIVADKFVIMPNHIHVIILLTGGHGNPLGTGGHDETLGTGGHGNPPLRNIVGQFKSFTTKRYNQLYNTNNLILWQRNYYEHIIRNDDDYQRICIYINENPLKWQEDKLFNGIYSE